MTGKSKTFKHQKSHKPLSREMIAKLERGKHIPKITTAEKLCRALHITFTIGEINEKDKNQ